MILVSYKFFELALPSYAHKKRGFSPRKRSLPYKLLQVLDVCHNHPNQGHKEDE